MPVRQFKNMIPGIDYNEEVPSPYRMPINELIERYSRLFTGVVHDVLQERGLHYQWLGPEIKCLTKDLTGQTVVGYAFTVQWISDPRPDERDRPAAYMVDSYPRNSVVVVDAGADPISGFWGDLATLVCLRNGVRGAVINGGAKDTGLIRAMGFPVFARFSTPVDGFFRARLRGWQIPIWFGDTLIRPWDLIIGDNDGVVVIPFEHAESVLVEAERRARAEEEIRAFIQAGGSAVQATEIVQRKDL
ncbi:MAG: RraA family protein [Candidatus Bathyarchaeia archaeon]